MKDLDRDLIAVRLWLRTQPVGEAMHLIVQRHVPRSADRQIADILLVGSGKDLLRRRLQGEVRRVLLAWGWHIHVDPDHGVCDVYPDTKHLTATNAPRRSCGSGPPLTRTAREPELTKAGLHPRPMLL